MKQTRIIRARRLRVAATAAAIGAAVSIVLTPAKADAHPLGNFTTNTATRLVVERDSISVLYAVDLAEIPSLKIRQQLGAVTGPVPAPVANQWRDEQCGALGRGLKIIENNTALTLAGKTSSVSFRAGQAGLSTIRLECNFTTAPPVTVGSSTEVSIAVSDTNFSDRLGWREITAVGNGTTLTDAISKVSPTKLLTTYATVSVGSPLRQVEVAFSARRATGFTSPTNAQPSASPSADPNRGNDGLTQRFQSLVARRHLTIPFAVGALLLAMVLGGLHAMAPGHGKTIMAAYAVSRRGSKGDIVAIGATVALTHTIGILILGSLVSATSVVSPDRTLRWASVVSGLLVVGVGVTLVRSRLMPIMARRASRHHDHDHPHDHPHDHDHDHPHSPEPALTAAHPTNDRYIVTSHSHGGWQHDHVLPAPGAFVRRRELIAMGLAGGIVPSPSALVVLLAAIALGRLPFGIALVVAYGLGLAATLVAAGLLLVRFERHLRRWTANKHTVFGLQLSGAVSVLPLVSGLAIIGAGLLLVARSVGSL